MNGTTNTEPAERFKPNPADLDHSRSGFCEKHGGYVGRCYRCPQAAPTTASLLADPANVAILRDLYAHARHIRAEHAVYSFGNGCGQTHGPAEHTWTADELRVSYENGELRFLSHGAPLLKVHTISVRQAAQLLAAIGVLPQRFIGGAK